MMTTMTLSTIVEKILGIGMNIKYYVYIFFILEMNYFLYLSYLMFIYLIMVISVSDS